MTWLDDMEEQDPAYPSSGETQRDDPPEYEPPEPDAAEYDRQVFEEARRDYFDHDLRAPF